MPVDDRNRLNLLRKLESVLGPEEANTLMEHLPPVTWNELATKSDVEASTVLLRADVHQAMTQLESSLRADMGQMESSLRRDMESIRTEVRIGFADMRTEFVERTNREIKWLVTFAAGWTSLLIGAVSLLS